MRKDGSFSGEATFAAAKHTKERDYWLKKLSGDLIKSHFPYDYEENLNKSHLRHLDTETFGISEDALPRLIQLSNNSDSRVYIILVTILILLLDKYTNNRRKDFIVGTPVYRQDIEGDFINSVLVLRNQFNDHMTFKELLLSVKQTIVEANENQNYPIETLLHKLNIPFSQKDDFPLFDIGILLESIHDKSYFKNFNLNMIFSFSRTAEYMQGVVDYNSSRYNKTTIQAIIRHFNLLLHQALSDVDRQIASIDILTVKEKKRLADFNQTRAPYPKEKTIHELFETQVEQTPDSTALQYEDKWLTYRELNKKANQLAHILRKKGVKPGTIVGLMVEPSPGMVIGILGILKAGGTYLPIDETIPRNRIITMLEDSQVSLLLTDSTVVRNEFFTAGSKGTYGREILMLDGLANPMAREPGHNLITINKPGDLAYIIFTSGSSGIPKGVLVKHQGLVNYINWAAKSYVNNESINFPLYTSISFDLTVTSLFTPLVTGNRVVIYRGDHKEPQMEKIINDNRVEVIKLTPSHLKLIRDKKMNKGISAVKFFIVGGEDLESGLARQIHENFNGKVKIYNEYGPTETVVGSMIHRFMPEMNKRKSVPIGIPVDNTQIYVLNMNQIPLPPGAPGELYIAGAGLARGYLNRPELTREKFCLQRPWGRFLKKLPPWTPRKNFLLDPRLYKTGDLAKWLPDGNMEFIGRVDQQLKIRGFRIEVGEIENQLLKYQGVSEVVVVPRQRKTHEESIEKYLCAYIVPAGTVEISQLREYMAINMPDYMIPSYFVLLEKIPLTPNGKIDKKALPAPESGIVRTEYAAPRNKIDGKLLEIWINLLKIPKNLIGIDHNFFDLGGHSLSATIMTSKIYKEFDVKVPLAEIFKVPTIRGITRFIKEAAKEKYAPIEPREKKEYYPLSSAQMRLYFTQQMANIGTAYNITAVFLVQGGLQKEKLEFSFRKLIARHESLRTSFELSEGEPVQKVHNQVEFKIEYDLQVSGALTDSDRCRWESSESSENESKNFKGSNTEGTTGLGPLPAETAECKAKSEKQSIEQNKEHCAPCAIRCADAIKNFIRPFDLSHAPLIRVGLLHTPTLQHSVRERNTEDKYILMVDMHHTISDGVSHVLMIKDFLALYKGEELPPLRLHYKDFAQWQDSEIQKEAIKIQEAYWLKEFAGEVPKLHLPNDFPRPAIQAFEGSTICFELSKEETAGLNSIALENKATLFLVLLSLTNIFLSKLSGQGDIVIGTPVAGRRHADLEPIIGMFVNMLALRNYPLSDSTFTEFLSQITERTLKAFENQDYPFEELVEKLAVERDISRNPLFDTAFALQNMFDAQANPSGYKIEHLDVQPYSYEHQTSKFDLTLLATEGEEKLHFTFAYSTQLFQKETALRFIDYFKKITISVIENPGKQISEIEIISEEERKLILFDFNNTGLEYPSDKVIHQLFEEQVVKTPDHIAVVGLSHLLLSYSQLNKKSNQLAGTLVRIGVQPDMPVGIMINRSVEMIVGLLAILKAGGAYLPIDPSYPEQRISYMLEDSNVGVLVTLPKYQVKIKAEAEQSFTPSRQSSLQFVNIETALAPAFDSSFSTFTSTSTCRTGSANLAYVLYTSGTTGKPKGVALKQQGLINLVIGLKERIYRVYKKTLNVSLVAPIVFDASVKQIFAALLLGHCLHIIPDDVKTDGISLSQFYERHLIELSDGTPGHIRLLLEADAFAGRCPVKQFLIGGEALPKKTTEQFFKRFGEESNGTYPLKIANLYGPTECTVDSTCFEVSQESVKGLQTIPIGTPMPNVRVYILNESSQLMPIGCAGELHISGDGIARGYLNRPELTAEKFNPDYRDGYNRSYRSHRSYIYKTGDLARWLADGNIESLGRIDRQVKIRGFRIELEEIQEQLLNHPLITEAVVTVRTEKNDDKYLCAYIVGALDDVPGSMELREYLSQTLPDYMIPTYFVLLDKIPLTPNGKVDRKTLPVPEIRTRKYHFAPRNRPEEVLTKIWADVLGIEINVIGIDSNFFELGGHSLKATILTARIHKEFNIKFTLSELFLNPTIRGLSTYIYEAKKEKHLSIEPVEKKEYYTLSAAQKRMYVVHQMEMQSTAYNMPLALELIGKLHPQRLEEAFRKLILRHKALRTFFIMTEDGLEPVQRIYETVEFEIQRLTTLTDAVDRQMSETDIHQVIKNFIQPFDLSQAPLLRVGLIKTGQQDHMLMIDMHHIISDGYSSGILFDDLIALYQGKALPRLKLQYKDFSEWQARLFQQGIMKKQEDYWLNQFSGDIPVLNIPADYPRPAVRSIDDGDQIWITLEKALTKKLYHVVEETNTTLFILLLAVYNLLLFKYTKQEDILVGSPVTGRTHVDLQHCVGVLLNMVPMRNRLRQDETFREVLTQIKENTLEAFENQDYPFDKLVSKLKLQGEANRNPLFDTEFALNNIDGHDVSNIEIPGLRFEGYPWKTQFAKFDLHLLAVETNDTLRLVLRYYTALFKKTTAEKIIKHYVEIIKQVVENLDMKLKDIKVSLNFLNMKSKALMAEQGDFDFYN